MPSFSTKYLILQGAGRIFEESHYGNVIKAPIQSRFLKQQGEPVMVKLPSKEDLLGDKLTAPIGR